MCNNGPQRGFETYAPSLVKEMGFGGLTSNALASVGLFVQIPVSFVFSWVSDRFNKRGETVIVGLSLVTLAYVFNRIFTEVANQGVRYFGVVWTQTFGTFTHPLNISWMSLACTDSEERALAMAMVISCANIAGIWGAQIFRSDDKPRYRRAFAIGLAVAGLGTLTAVVRKIEEVWLKKRDSEKIKVAEPLSENDVEVAPVVAGTGKGL
jgi:MFS family permease